MPTLLPALFRGFQRLGRSKLLQSGAILRRTVTLGLSLVAFAASSSPCPSRPELPHLQSILPGIAVVHGHWPSLQPLGPDRHATTVVLWTDKQATVLDPGPNWRWGHNLRQQLRCQLDLRVVQVINSHAHAEQVLANGALAAPVAATAATRAAMRRRCSNCLAALRRDLGDAAVQGTRITLPQQTLREGQTLHAGGRLWQVLDMVDAHTESDLVLWSAADQIVLAGPLLDTRPLVLAQGSVRGWLRALDRIETLQPQWLIGQHLVAGPGQAQAVLRQQRQALCEPVRLAWLGLEQGWSEAEALQAMPDNDHSDDARRQQRFNLLRVWREMEVLWMGQQPMPLACAHAAP